MSYEYLDPKRASEPHALPDVEVFWSGAYPCECYFECNAGIKVEGEAGFWYAYGSPGYLWDSDPVGPFDTALQALESARDEAGVGPHA